MMRRKRPSKAQKKEASDEGKYEGLAMIVRRAHVRGE